MTKKLSTLAAALAALSIESSALESTADSVLAIVKADGIRDLKTFSAAVRTAYTANGWRAKQGKPVLGAAKQEKVPGTVKQYVSMVRAAYKFGLTVAKFQSFHALRMAVKAARVASAPAPVLGDPRLKGLRLVSSDSLLGAPFHDLAVVYTNLPKSQQAQMVGAVNRLVAQFQQAAPALLKAA